MDLTKSPSGDAPGAGLRDKDWRALIWAVQQQRCVVLLGPEIDAGDDHSPITQRLAQKLVADCSGSAVDSSLAAAAQQYGKEYGVNNLIPEVIEFYDQQGEPLPVHQDLAALPFYFVVTSCHDLLLERALTAAGRKPRTGVYGLQPDARTTLLPTGSVASPLIYHLYGATSVPGSLVLTESDLLDFLVNVASGNPPLPQTVTSELRREHVTLLFLGFGVKHWYLRILLHVLKLSRSERSFALEIFDPPDGPALRSLVLFYRDGYKIDVFNVGVGTFIRELRRRFEHAGGAAVVEPQKPGLMVPPRIFICYAKEDAARAKRLFGELQAAGLDPWMDEKLEGGTQWDSVIQEQVSAADYFLVVHTRRLAEKEFSYVNREIYLGLQRQQFARQGVRFIIPLALDDAPIIADLSHLQAERVPDLEDVSALVSLIKRDYQRRARQVAAS